MAREVTRSWLFRCADDRYHPGLELHAGLARILDREGLPINFGPMTPFGCSLAFSNPVFLQYLEGELPVARHLGINRVILIDHLDCRSYALAFGRMPADLERSCHLERIAVARRWFAERAPDMAFVAYLQDGEQASPA
jgi:hypothetical protein